MVLTMGRGLQTELMNINKWATLRNYSQIIKKWVPIFVLALVIFGIYANSFNNDFIWDDINYIENNKSYEKIQNIKKVFSNDYFSMSGELSYRPVATISYFLNYNLWGKNIIGWRISNVFLHFLNVFLIYLLVDLVFKSKYLSMGSSLLFATHPVATESILGISFNEELLFSFFALLSILFYIKKHLTNGNKRFYFPIYLFYVLALFSKETAIVLPALFLIYDFSFRRRKKVNIFFYFNVFLISIFYLWIRFSLMPGRNLNVSYIGGNIMSNTLTMIKVFVSYLRLLICPINLRPIYYFSILNSLDLKVILSFSVVLLIVVLLIFAFKFNKEIFFFSSWLLLPLMPVMNLIPFLKYNYLAERYLYFSIAPAMVLIVLITMKIFPVNKSPIIKILKNGILATIISIFCIIVIKRNTEWSNDLLFWKKAVEREPGHFFTHISLGTKYNREGLIEKAIEQYKIATEINPIFGPAYITLADMYFKEGEMEKAYKSYIKGLNIDFKNAHGHFNLGFLYYELGKYESAIQQFQRVINLNKNNDMAYYCLSEIYAEQKRYDEAMNILKNGLTTNPNSSKIRKQMEKYISK